MFRKHRELVQVSAGFEGPHISGQGLTRDISTSGARIEEIDGCPPVGMPLVVQLFIFPNQQPLTVEASVVRQTESGGFAVEFDTLDHRMCDLLRLTLASHPIGRPAWQNERRPN